VEPAVQAEPDELGPCPLIQVDKDATGAVHDGFSSAQEFCAGIAMAGKQNSKRAQGQP